MKIVAVALVLAGLAYLAGCATYRVGRQSPAEAIETTPKFTLGAVEFDDQGWFRDRKQAATVVSTVDSIASLGGATIVVFVHGWHHSPRADDCNLQDFKRTLERLHDELDLEVYRNARASLGLSPESRIVGVFVGWRGRSLPGPLDLLTFWDRKAAATRVGHGDVPELLTRIHDIYIKYNCLPKYTGLVTIGHSFGAQVTFAAISDILKSRLASAVPLDDLQQKAEVLHGFGDLVVLVNPAMEASVFDRISDLTRLRTFSQVQTPVLLVVSSEADWPNKTCFPIGRSLAVEGEPHGSDRQYRDKVRALGWVREQITHCLALDGGAPCEGFPERHVSQRNSMAPAPNDSGPKAGPGELDRAQAERNAGAWKREDAEHPEQIELAAELGMAGTRFYRVDPRIDPNLPFVVAKATADIIADHNDMFNENFVNFLVRYAAGAELKRVALALRAARAPNP